MAHRHTLRHRIPQHGQTRTNFRMFRRRPATQANLLLRTRHMGTNTLQFQRTIFTRRQRRFTTRRVFTNRPHQRVHSTGPNRHTASRHLNVVNTRTSTHQTVRLRPALLLRAPNRKQNRTIPIRTVIFGRLRQVNQRTTAFRVIETNTNGTRRIHRQYHRRPHINRLPNTRRRVSFTRIRALRISGAISRVRLRIRTQVRRRRVNSRQHRVSAPRHNKHVRPGRPFEHTTRQCHFHPHRTRFNSSPPHTLNGYRTN